MKYIPFASIEPVWELSAEWPSERFDDDQVEDIAGAQSESSGHTYMGLNLRDMQWQYPTYAEALAAEQRLKEFFKDCPEAFMGVMPQLGPRWSEIFDAFPDEEDFFVWENEYVGFWLGEPRETVINPRYYQLRLGDMLWVQLTAGWNMLVWIDHIDEHEMQGHSFNPESGHFNSYFSHPRATFDNHNQLRPDSQMILIPH